MHKEVKIRLKMRPFQANTSELSEGLISQAASKLLK